MKRTSASLAPVKGPWMRRVLHPDFLGINWTKITMRTPFNSSYPHQLSSGNLNRLYSNPISWGFFPNRTSRAGKRMNLLMLPSLGLAAWCVFMPDVWTCYSATKIAADELMIPYEIPESILEQRRKDNYEMARNKPGAYLKHRYGGQVSIPGSEAWME